VTVNQKAVRWWQDHLEEGRRLVAIGGSDVHYIGLNSLYPCNYVLAASNQPDDIQAAIDEGRLGISKDQDGPRVFAWADADGDLEYETPMGANLSVTSRKRIGVRVTVKNGNGRTLFLYTHQGVIWSKQVDSDDWELRASAMLDASSRTFLRAELRASDNNYMKSMTNPIYVNYVDD
jgi:hypothetical protein